MVVVHSKAKVSISDPLFGGSGRRQKRYGLNLAKMKDIGTEDTKKESKISSEWKKKDAATKGQWLESEIIWPGEKKVKIQKC